MCADAPDTSGMNAAALQSAELGREALAYYKEKDAADAPMRQKLADTAYEVAQQQLTASKSATALSEDYAKYNKETFRPLEQGIVADAEAYDTPEKRQAAADSAVSDTNIAFDSTNKMRQQQLAANGIDPGSARAMAAMEGQGVSQATAQAGAAYKARQGVETIGRGMKMDAASLGRGLASNQATSASLALNAGNSAVANTGVPVTASQNATSTMGNGYSTAISGQQVAGNIYGKIADVQSQDTGIWGAVGQIGGAALSKWSDETLKKDIEPADPEAARDEIVGTQVSDFQYDPAKLAARGIPEAEVDAGTSTGPMAQDVEANMGEDAAPGGEKINLVTMNGKNMLTLQVHDREIKAIEKKVSMLASMIQSGKFQAGARA